MVIVGLTGTLSSGKETAAKYLQLMHGFILYNLESQDWEESHPSNLNSGINYESEESYRVAISNQVLKQMMKDLKLNYIVYPLTLPEEVQVFRKRSYFICIGVDGPLTSRYEYYSKKHGKPKNQLQGFIYMDDHV